MKMKKILLVALSLLLLLAFGCSDDTNNSSVTNPNTNPFTPKGSVAGVLTDRVTSEPIVGAVVHIYDRYATTGADGAFVIKNVPANTPVDPLNALGNGYCYDSDECVEDADYYNVTIDMAKVNKDRLKANPSATLYPAYAYDYVSVKYSSLGESLITGENATNHDTPVNGFVANMDVHIAKLESTVKIQVVNCITNLPVNGATVTLRSSVHTNNNATGNPGNPVQASKLTGTDGYVTFTNVEAMQSFFAVATSGNLDGVLSVASRDRLDVSEYSRTDRTPLCISSDDHINPWITGTTPPFGADIALPADNTLPNYNKATVVFAFSEDIYGASVTPDSTYYAGRTTAETSVVNGIFRDIHVYYQGSKQSMDPEIAKTVAWLDAKTLAVTFDALPASRYTVVLNDNPSIFPMIGLKDLALNPMNMWMGFYPVTFTTAGSVALSAPVVVTGQTEGGWFDYLSWAYIPNAYEYKVCEQRISSDGTQLGMQCHTTGDNYYDFAGTLDFSNGYTYQVTVVARSLAGIESAPSNTITLADTKLAAVTNFHRIIIDTCSVNKFDWDAYPNAAFYEIQVDQYIGGTLAVGGSKVIETTNNISEYLADYTGPDAWISNYGDDTWKVGEMAVTYAIKVRAAVIGGHYSAWSDDYVISAPGCDIAVVSALPAPTGLVRVGNAPLYSWDAYALANHYEVMVERYRDDVLITSWSLTKATSSAGEKQYLFFGTGDDWFTDNVDTGNGSFWDDGNITYKVKVRAIFDDNTFTKWSDQLMWTNPLKAAFGSLDTHPSLFTDDILDTGAYRFADVLSNADQTYSNVAAGISLRLRDYDLAPDYLLSHSGDSATLLISISFNKIMNKASVQTATNWHIGATETDADLGSYRINSLAVAPQIVSVRYDEVHNRAMIYIKYMQNPTNNGARFDFNHQTFTFTGTDVSGAAMDPLYDTITGDNQLKY